MKRFVLLALFLLGVPLTAQPRSTDASIGVWPWLVGNIDRYATEIIDRAKSTGLDTIYLHVWRTTGRRFGELRIVDESGTWNSADGRLIPLVTLSAFVRRAHAAGLQVVGVVQIFRSSVLPSDYSHQDFMIQKVIRYLVHSYDRFGRRRYPLDGIALDYIRWFGGNHTSREVNRFLDELRQEVGPLPIHAYLPAGAYAVDGGSYDNRFRSVAAFDAYVIRNYGQDWAAMAARIDCLLPMAYTANGHVYGTNLAFMQGYLTQVAKHARRAVVTARTRCRVVVAIRTWNSRGQTTTQGTVEASCRGAMLGGADGFMAFRYFTARGHNSWFTGLARFCEPGPDWPVADADLSVAAIQATVDTSRSWHAKVPRSRLSAHLDLDGDGEFEIGPLPLGRTTLTMLRPAGRLASVRILDPRGHSAVTTRRVNGTEILTSSASSISIDRGGMASMQLRPGRSQAGQGYIVFCSLSGTSPGTALGAVTVPLNVDLITTLVFNSRNTPLFPQFAGTIDTAGSANPRFVLPARAIPNFWAGNQLYFAAVGLDNRTFAATYASGAVQVKLTR